MKISSLLTNASIASGLAAVAMISAPLTASAATFNFSNIAGADTVGDSLAPFLSFDVDAGSSGGTVFTFKFDAASPTGFIRTVYIDSAVGTTLLGTSITIQDAPPAVDFNGGVGSDNLPQGNEPSVNPNFTTDYAFNRVTGSGNSKAINPGESLSVLFSSANFNSVLSAIEGGSLRVGYHVQGINLPGVTGASDSYINTTTSRPVPVPGLLLGVVAAGFVGGSRLMKKKQSA